MGIIMKTSDSIDELAAALCKAQAAMRTAPMSGTNPHLRNRYATLNDIIDTARRPLADNGLSYVQMPCNPDGIDVPFIGLTTRIMHQSGQWIETTLFFPMDGGANKAVSAVQAAGSVLTYMRRYALGAALGIVADEDADGNAPPARQQAPTPPPNAKPTAAQPAQAPGPLPDDELTIEEAPAAQFIPAAAALLETDTDTLKARLKALGYERIPGKPAERVAAYRALKADMGHRDDIMQPATQPALVTVAQPATDYQD